MMILSLGKIKLILLFILATNIYSLPLVDDDIGQEIFHENKPYLLYVSDFIDDRIVETLQTFCKNERLCAVMIPEVEMYEKFVDFVGMHTKEYLLILDVENRLKYTLPIDSKLKNEDITEFYEKFIKKQLAPYYTSEKLPETQPDTVLKKIVGLNLEQFISGPQTLKVLYLYTNDELCSTCFQIYEKIVKIAKQFDDRSQTIFGFLDLFKNQHILLKQDEVPVILLFEGTRQYVKITGQEISKLESIILSKLTPNGNTEL